MSEDSLIQVNNRTPQNSSDSSKNVEDIRGFGERFYRTNMGADRFRSFSISCKDSDLWIGIDSDSFLSEMIEFAHNKLFQLRYTLESYINSHPLFGSSFIPVKTNSKDPMIAIEMSRVTKLAGTGPMAAVAGAFSEYIGKALLEEFRINEIVVENGGDIFLKLKSNLILTVYAGTSPLSCKIGLEIPALSTPLGVCTSAGTVGPSISFGKADAVMIAAKNTAYADAFATAFGNLIKSPDDIAAVIEKAKQDEKILSAVMICNDKIGICGQFKIYPLETK